MVFLGVRLGNESQLNPAEIQELAVTAENLGYQEIWMTEGAGRDSLTQLTAIAAATHRIVAGTGILPIFSRTPLITAMSAAGIAAVSLGRFILGWGLGTVRPLEMVTAFPSPSLWTGCGTPSQSSDGCWRAGR